MRYFAAVVLPAPSQGLPAFNSSVQPLPTYNRLSGVVYALKHSISTEILFLTLSARAYESLYSFRDVFDL